MDFFFVGIRYNYDFVKDEPMRGRYEWIGLNEALKTEWWVKGELSKQGIGDVRIWLISE